VVEVVVEVVDSFPQDDPTTTTPEPLEPHKALPAKAKVVATEQEVAVVVVDKMVVPEVQLLVAMMVLFRVKMATVWHPEVV
jgi:hypothetical protein